MEKLEPVGEEQIAYQGKIFEIVKQPMQAGKRTVVFETARRAPGARIIIVKEGKLLLAKEYRTEHKGFDYRLPGGKVFDTNNAYREAIKNQQDIEAHAIATAKKECEEEVGITVQKIKHFVTARSGATVEWDLYYFIVDQFEETGVQKLESGEVIKPEWKTFDQVKQLCVSGEMKEYRSVGVLWRFLSSA